jgi:hypothetical protein
MRLRVGFEMNYDFPQPTPMIMVLGTHFTRASDVIVPDYLTTSPSVPIAPYRDMFGNWCSRIVAPAGPMRLAADGIIRDDGLPDPPNSRRIRFLARGQQGQRATRDPPIALGTSCEPGLCRKTARRTRLDRIRHSSSLGRQVAIHVRFGQSSIFKEMSASKVRSGRSLKVD